MKKLLYECDPKKNKECPNSNCVLNGGSCHLTTEEKFEKTTKNKTTKKVKKDDKS